MGLVSRGYSNIFVMFLGCLHDEAMSFLERPNLSVIQDFL